MAPPGTIIGQIQTPNVQIPASPTQTAQVAPQPAAMTTQTETMNQVQMAPPPAPLPQTPKQDEVKMDTSQTVQTETTPMEIPQENGLPQGNIEHLFLF